MNAAKAARLQSNATPLYLRFLKILVARSSMSNNHGADDVTVAFITFRHGLTSHCDKRMAWGRKVLSILTRLLTNVTHKENSMLSSASRKQVDPSFRNLAIELLVKLHGSQV